MKTHREKARVLALKAAKEKAVKMAAVFDQVVGLPIDISEVAPSAYSSDLDIPFTQNSMNATVPYAPSPRENAAIALGKIAVCARVNVTFELKR